MDLGFVHRYDPSDSGATLLLLHGTGGDENDLVPLAGQIAPGAGILSPRGRVSEQGMPRFFRRLGMGRFDLEDLAVQTEALGDFIEASAGRYGFDREKLIAVGYSNGANIAASLLLRRPGTVSSAALLHAMVPFEPEGPVDLAGTRVLLTSGSADQMIPLESSRRLETLLREAGAEVEHEVFPGGHGLTNAELEKLRDWVEEAMV